MKRWTLAWLGAGILFVGIGVLCMGADLVISEIAWAGTAASANDEWIELQNIGGDAIELEGWRLLIGESPDVATIAIHLGEVAGKTVESRTATLAPGAFLLLERTDDTTVSDIMADIIYTGTLSNSGVMLYLVDPAGTTVDRVDLAAWGWSGGGSGDADVPYATMERTPDLTWKGNDGRAVNGADADGNALNGTPGRLNSAEASWPYAPRVVVSSPQGEDTVVLTGDIIVSWTASDPDGADPALEISIALQPSDGASPVLLEAQLANGGSYAFDSTAHDDGLYSIVVHAIDAEGYESSCASSEFEILNEP